MQLEVTREERWLIMRALRRLAADSNVKVGLDAQRLVERLVDERE